MTPDQLVEEIRAAAATDDPVAAVRDYLSELIKDPARCHSLGLPEEEDEDHYYEDDSISIWNCRFRPGKVVPPHEHLMTVHIASYGGKETNYLFKHEGGKLDKVSTAYVPQGEVFTLEKDAIHAVTAEGPEPSYAIHVYFGPLTKVHRNLFDWENGTRVPFTDADYERLARAADQANF